MNLILRLKISVDYVKGSTLIITNAKKACLRVVDYVQLVIFFPKENWLNQILVMSEYKI